MAAQRARSLKAVTLCLVAWVVMGFVSLVHHAVAVTPAQAPMAQACASLDGCAR